ncbi:unnamed protein product [Somion occarium]|uniref:SHSP domain-containing protein n=1 Tax=Somion occarium TaxID=3059160 RepID=A0ABP1DP74_9APHY
MPTQPPNGNASASITKFRTHVRTDTEKITKLCDRILATRYLQLQKKRRALMAKPVARTYIPRMDICDDEHIPRVFAALELPGVRRESLTLQVINDYLLVEGDRATPLQAVLSTCSPSPVEGEGQSPTTDRDGVASAPPSIPHYSTRELAFGRFKREVALPKGITVCLHPFSHVVTNPLTNEFFFQANQVTADLMEGMLYLSWPRNPGTYPTPQPSLSMATSMTMPAPAAPYVSARA